MEISSSRPSAAQPQPVHVVHVGPEVLCGGGPHAPGLRWIGALLQCAVWWDEQILDLDGVNWSKIKSCY